MSPFHKDTKVIAGRLGSNFALSSSQVANLLANEIEFLTIQTGETC